MLLFSKLEKPDEVLFHSSLFCAGAALNSEHREQLTEHNTALIKNMKCTSGLLDHLFECRVLDQQELESINAIPVSSDKNRQLLEYVKRSSQEQYLSFLECLRRSDQPHVFDCLIATHRK